MAMIAVAHAVSISCGRMTVAGLDAAALNVTIDAVDLRMMEEFFNCCAFANAQKVMARKFDFVLARQKIDLGLGVSEFVFESPVPSARGPAPHAPSS